jgi:hypothetical protein
MENDQMQKSEVAWKTAARLAALADEAEDPEKREYFARIPLSTRVFADPTQMPSRSAAFIRLII